MDPKICEMQLIVHRDKTADDEAAIQIVQSQFGAVEIIERTDAAREEIVPALVTKECRHRGLRRIKHFAELTAMLTRPIEAQ